MKKLSSLLAIILLAVCNTLSGRTPENAPKLSVEETLRAAPEKAGGLMYVYDYKEDAPMTPAPKGYKPFYVSHFGRHGARYATGTQYKLVKKVLDKAKADGSLTERGERLHEDYTAFYEKAIYHDGELSEVGIEQQRTIAGRLGRRFPEVFKGKTHAVAISTPSHRVILSMASFLDALQEMDRSFTVEESYSEAYSPVLRPNWSPLAKDRPDKMDKLTEQYIPYFNETVDVEGIMGRILLNPMETVKRLNINAERFLCNLFDIVNGNGCLRDEEAVYDGIFTEADLIPFIRAAWFRDYLFLTRYKGSPSLFPDYAAYTLKDILDRADEDIASGDVQLRLRFSHDSSLIPFMALLNVDGLGETASTPEEALDIFPLWEMPMGGSLQLVFYRRGAKDDILVKLLRNEREASLPVDSVEGPYYRWTDVSEYCRKLIDSSLAGISSLQVHGTMPSKPMWRPLPFQEPPSASRSFQSTGTLTKVLPVNSLLRRFLRHRALSESQGS